MEWRIVPARERAGGLLCVWKASIFSLEECVPGEGFLWLRGKWKEVDSVIVNVYSLYVLGEKRKLRENLRELRRRYVDLPWCLVGDFNSVRRVEERRGIRGEDVSGASEMEEFNGFIDAMELDDIPAVGRKFTWTRPNGKASSRLDRFLVSYPWSLTWPECAQYVLQRDVSNHCPLVLKCSHVDWGPKPFKTRNCWLLDPSFGEFVSSSWSNLSIKGWGAFVFKEKLKLLKHELKQWNKEKVGDLDRKCKELVKSINVLDLKAEEGGSN
ncbi:uncharacterized protein LOC130725120 [Lotus japonicus]|uniref:uncharacterized protein LOC130725120 n=1 Tax=Lotus japonicus TaxID=34305 RepID=UPI002586E4C1|nr:uncharacterized protein LOC130725120 [Lotus japonicus]